MTSTANDPSPRATVGCLYLVIVAGLIVGALAFGRYFVAEHQRLSFGEGVLVWLGDVVTFFWASVYFVRHTLLGVPFEPPAMSTRRRSLPWFLALLSILASLGADVWFTLSLRASEREKFATARRTTGTIHSLTKVNFPNKVAYALHCSYVDANQVAHTRVFELRDPDELPNLAPPVVQAVRAEQLPTPVAIAYDPDRPERSWLADLGWQDKTRMHGFSLCVLLFQMIAAAVFVTMLAGVYHSTGHWPWWRDLYAVWFLAVEAAFVLLFGGLGLLSGGPFFWGDL